MVEDVAVVKKASHPGGNPGANLKSTSYRCYLFEVAFVWELTQETTVLPLGCLQGGFAGKRDLLDVVEDVAVVEEAVRQHPVQPARTPRRMTGVTLHSHVRYTQPRAEPPLSHKQKSASREGRSRVRRATTAQTFV